MNYHKKNRIHDDITRHFTFLKDETHRDILHLFPCKGKYHSIIETVLGMAYLGHIKKERWLHPGHFLYDFGSIPDYKRILLKGKLLNDNEILLRYINNLVYQFDFEHIIQAKIGKRYAIDLFVELERLNGGKKLGFIFEIKPHYVWIDKYKSDVIRQLKLYESVIQDDYAEVYKFIVSNLKLPTNETDLDMLQSEKITWLHVNPYQEVNSHSTIMVTKKKSGSLMYHPKQEIVGNINKDIFIAKDRIKRSFITDIMNEDEDIYRPNQIEQIFVKGKAIEIKFKNGTNENIPIIEFMKYQEAKQKLLDESEKAKKDLNKLKGTLKIKKRKLAKLQNKEKKRNRKLRRR